MPVSWILKVVDCSYWNSFNLQALWDLGVRVLILRASSGATYRDPQFAPVYAVAKAIGFKVLAYHVNHPFYSAQANFNNFVSAIAGFDLDGPPVLDNELTGGQTWTTVHIRTKELFYLLKAKFGQVINYTRKYFWDYLGNTSWVLEFPLHVASYWNSLGAWLWPHPEQYTSTIPNVYIDQESFLWQFSDKGLHYSVSSGNVDKNVGYPRFAAMLKKEPALPDSLPVPINIATIIVAALNVRSGAGTNYSSWTTVPANLQLYVFEVQDISGVLWGRIGVNAWIAIRSVTTTYAILS